MKIAVYMSDFIYKYGGAEGYAANLISVLQNIFKNDIITIITECYKNDGLITEAQFADKQNKAYGLQIKPDFIKIRYINAKKAENICKENKILDTIQFIKRQNSFLKLQKQIKEISKTFDLFISCVARWSFFGDATKNCVIIHFPKDRLSTIPINKKIPWCKLFAKKQDNSFANSTDLFIPNSEFTSYWLTQKWQISDDKKCVLYPPVTPVSTKSEKKRNQIFVCSRIESTKKIDLLLNPQNFANFLYLCLFY